jgi:hypothetical protein
MTINGKNVGFTVTIGALKELIERCPDRDIEKITELFKGDDMIASLDHMAWFIAVLSRWHCYRETRTFDGAIDEADIYAMNTEEIQELFAEAMKTFRKDNTPTTEVTTTGKKG